MTFSSKALIFFILINLSAPSILKAQMVLIKNFGLLSISNSKNTTMTISPYSKEILLRKNKETIRTVFKKNITLTTYETYIKDRKYIIHYTYNHLSQNTSTVVDIISDHAPHYLEIASCSTVNPLEKTAIQINELTSFASNSVSPNIKENLIDESCRSLLNKRFLKLLNEEISKFSSVESHLAKCFSSKTVESKLKNEGEPIPHLITRILNSYNNDSTMIASKGVASFVIKCEQYSSPPSFLAKYKDNSITIPVFNSAFNLEDDCHNLSSVLTHEYIHHAGIENETEVEKIDNLCRSILSPATNGSPACSGKQRSEMLTSLKKADELKLKSHLQEKTAEIIANEQKEISPKLVQELEKAPLKEVKVSDATWSSLANDPNATIPTAERNSIAATMNSNFESMSGSLNRALGATQTPALAANDSPASSSSGSSSASSETTGSGSGSGSRSPASSYERAERETYSSDSSKNSRGSRGSKESTGPSNEFHTVEEYIVDSKNAKDPRSFNIPGARQGASADRGQDQSVAATTRQGMSATASTGENPAEGSQVTNAGRARNSEIARSASGGEFAGGDVSSGGTSSLPAQGSGSGLAPARGSNRRQPASQGGGSSSNAFNGGNSVSSLKEQTLIRGSDYESITSNYRRRDFSNELHQQGVSIYIEKQGMSLGRSDAKIKFIDNGEYLRRAEGN